MSVTCFIGDGQNRNSQDDAILNALLWSEGCVIVDKFLSSMAATIHDNNTVRIATGIAFCEGRPVMINYGTAEDFTIPTGQQGTTTTYYLGFKLSSDSDGKLNAEKIVSTTKTAQGSLLRGDDEMYCWLYSATVVGVELQKVTSLCESQRLYAVTMRAIGTVVDATEATLTSISASYAGGTVTTGTATTALTGLTVTGTYSDGTTATLTGYTLSPSTIAEGTNTITVTYNDLTTTFTVTGSSSGGGTTTTTYKVTASAVNIRSGPGTNYGVLTSASQGAILTYAGNSSSGWLQVTYNGTTGWVSSSYVTKVS